MKKGEESYLLILASAALFLFVIIFSSAALAANNGDALAFQGKYEEAIKAYDKAIELILKTQSLGTTKEFVSRF